GSPLYAALLGQLADDVAAGGPGARVLAGHEDDPGPAALALRRMAAVHRLVLAGQAPALAAHYPSTGGDGHPEAAWLAFRAVLDRHAAPVRAGLAPPPQTNEVGRAAGLFGGLLWVVAHSGAVDLPIRLHELGAAAGLNLLADHLTYTAQDGGGWRPAELPTAHLDPAWQSQPVGILPPVDLVHRSGCDLRPLDPRSPEGTLSLLSCVWPDQQERLTRLRAAVRVAQRHPVPVHRQGAGDYLDSVDLLPGHHTVIWHSVMWQYLPVTEQQRVLDRLTALGAAATPERRLTHLSFEPRRLWPDGPHRFVVSATTWPGGEQHLLGQAPPHGVPVRWADPREEQP